ncbi:meiosis-specific protein MEI4-like [Labrus mixtus]|uniref:meiosis-specific protein MEI4-like n=1 Tax=Labrus mixtus TaxID=508554 RepID=UPI0029BFF2BC|nr:meiosis-specific protein MEI4-like [Labrus mixtus]
MTSLGINLSTANRDTEECHRIRRVTVFYVTPEAKSPSEKFLRGDEVNGSRVMENQQDDSRGASQAAWILQKARVALAVAIIRNRPPGMSGREHAEALGCKLRTRDESWKKKAQELQQEVLSLRQESLINRVTSNTKSSTEAAGRTLLCMCAQNLLRRRVQMC